MILLDVERFWGKLRWRRVAWSRTRSWTLTQNPSCVIRLYAKKDNLFFKYLLSRTESNNWHCQEFEREKEILLLSGAAYLPKLLPLEIEDAQQYKKTLIISYDYYFTLLQIKWMLGNTKYIEIRILSLRHSPILPLSHKFQI